MSRERLEPSAVSPLERQLLIGAASSSQGKPKTQPIGASPLLSQLKQFLPRMQQANAELQQKLQDCDPAELDIEHIPEQEGEGQVIQMDLACGLLELHDQAAVAAAQRAIAAGGEIAIETYDGGSSSDSDSESSDDDDGDDKDSGSGAVSEGGAAASQGASKAKPAAAAAAAAADAMDEDTPGAAAAAAADAAAAATAQGQNEQQQEQSGNGSSGSSKQRRKLKPMRPMIQELS